MRIITDSAADFTSEELLQYQIHCVPMQVIFGEESLSADELPADTFWNRLLPGEIAKTSQPSPDAFLTEFESAAKQTMAAIEAMDRPEIRWFVEHCLPAFSLNLDELN